MGVSDDSIFKIDQIDNLTYDDQHHHHHRMASAFAVDTRSPHHSMSINYIIGSDFRWVGISQLYRIYIYVCDRENAGGGI